MGQINQAGSGPELDRVDGDHERTNLSGLGPKISFPIVQRALFLKFLEHNRALGWISPHPQF